MRTGISCFILWSALCLTVGITAEPHDPTKIVEDGIRAFYRDVVSTDDKISTAAFKTFLIDETGLHKLYGKEDGTKLWSLMSQLFENPEMLQKMRQDIVNKGPIKKVELIDVRTNDVSGRFKKILTVIPTEVPVYRALITTDKGEAGSSSFVVINNQVRFIKGLESLPDALKQQGK
jgi:hypothetical protein